ncbi:AraC family transcriptional regulator [Paenibacillus glycinis]|uniref:Helix-turn-helix domain-containing protein n=1 Tax=Paenibacillus glycinis TaxID=2697035 RepID=A0ABW9XXI1_9BACL|nr:AraC family transcriptional regulator [Paenibacillus glycinis]NBD27410.1 helix-turn-helix domain-containing protein [Paenibacillus glycinis]
MQPKETVTVHFGEEEGDFFLQQVNRTSPFEAYNHYHSTYEVYYLLSGRRQYFIKDSMYSVAAGDLIFINKHDVHKTSVLGSPQHERIVINFSDAFLGDGHPMFRPELLRLFERDRHQYRLKPQEQWHAEELFRKMTDEIKQQEDGFELSLRLLLSQLLLFASRLKDAEVPATDDPLSPSHRLMAEVVKFMNAHYREKLSLPSLADRFGMSPSYFSRMFRSVTGFTVIGYLNLARIREAQALLAKSSLKVADISEKVGFEQFAHFNRTFKRMIGTNPTRYRKWNS